MLLCESLDALFLQLLGYTKGEEFFHPSLLHNLRTSIELFAQEKRGRGPEKAENHMAWMLDANNTLLRYGRCEF